MTLAAYIHRSRVIAVLVCAAAALWLSSCGQTQITTQPTTTPPSTTPPTTTSPTTPPQSAAILAANEAAAIKTVRALAEDQMLYFNGHQRDTFGTFDEMLKFNLLDNRFAGTTPVVAGYIFTMRILPKSVTQPPGYTVNADPQQTDGVDATGKYHYYIDNNSNMIHVNSSLPATANDPPLGSDEVGRRPSVP